MELIDIPMREQSFDALNLTTSVTKTICITTSNCESNSDSMPLIADEKLTLILTKSNLKAKTLESIEVDNDVGFLVGTMVWQTLSDRLMGCHFLVLTQDVRHPIVRHVFRSSMRAFQPLVLIDVNGNMEENHDYFKKAIWGDDNTVCRTILIDFTAEDDDVMLRFLSSHLFSRWPRAWVISIGDNSKARPILLHDVFRNVLQPVYIGFKKSILEQIITSDRHFEGIRKNPFLMNTFVKQAKMEDASVYTRCLYCSFGNQAVRFLFLWPIGSTLQHSLNLFTEQHSDTKGHLFRVVSMPVFPFNTLRFDSDEPATTVTLLDCLDKRLLDTISSHLNFTYETRAPWDKQFGMDTESGNFTGMVGTLQYNKADFSTIISPNPRRNTVMDCTRVYIADSLIVVSLKPQLLPQYLVIIRPFTAEMWVYLVISIVAWAVAFWVLQSPTSRQSGSYMDVSTAFFYSWAVILEDPPQYRRNDLTSKILVTVWLMVCFIITTGYKASLVSFLAVQLKSQPINSFKELVARGDYSWGMEGLFLRGAPGLFFQVATDPSAKLIYKNMEPLENYKEAFDKIIKGKYAYIGFETLSKMYIDSYYTDKYGITPYYVSREGYSMSPYLGWGYVKGAPFRQRFNIVISRLIDAGVINHWKKEIVYKAVKRNRKAIIGNEEGEEKTSTQFPDENTLTLKLDHLIGVFMVFFIGFGISFVTVILENIIALKLLRK